MPQVDLETIVCGGSSNDRKIACETETTTDTEAEPHSQPEKLNLPQYPIDFPPESYSISKDDEYDWFDRNAFFDRKGSTKGNSSPTISISRRYYLNFKSKASILGLPKAQKTNYLDGKIRRNCKQANPRFFPKRSRSTGKSTVPLSEPSSPKVSCIGRVRSKRSRSRRLKRQQTTHSTPSSEKTGLWTKVKAKLKLGRRKNQLKETSVKDKTKTLPARKMSLSSSERFEPAPELSGLADLKRFASGRRSESWIGCDVDDEKDEQAKPVWARRGAGPLMEVQVERDWEYVGPVTL